MADPSWPDDDIEPEFSVRVREEDGGPVLVVRGDIDMGAVEPLEDAIAALPADRPLVIDLADVTFLDSSGLTMLVRARRAREGGPEAMVLRRPRSGVLWVLETSGVAGILTLEGVEPEAP